MAYNQEHMTAITINRIPAKLSKELKRFTGSRSGYARKALAEKLIRDGRADLAGLLTKAAPATTSDN